MRIFEAGEDKRYSFTTREGIVDVLATVVIAGRKLELRDAAVFAGDGTRIYPGVRQVLEITRQVMEYAALESFESVTVTGKRISGAKPGRPVFIRRTL